MFGEEVEDEIFGGCLSFLLVCWDWWGGIWLVLFKFFILSYLRMSLFFRWFIVFECMLFLRLFWFIRRLKGEVWLRGVLFSWEVRVGSFLAIVDGLLLILGIFSKIWDDEVVVVCLGDIWSGSFKKFICRLGVFEFRCVRSWGWFFIVDLVFLFLMLLLICNFFKFLFGMLFIDWDLLFFLLMKLFWVEALVFLFNIIFFFFLDFFLDFLLFVGIKCFFSLLNFLWKIELDFWLFIFWLLFMFIAIGELGSGWFVLVGFGFFWFIVWVGGVFVVVDIWLEVEGGS